MFEETRGEISEKCPRSPENLLYSTSFNTNEDKKETGERERGKEGTRRVRESERQIEGEGWNEEGRGREEKRRRRGRQRQRQKRDREKEREC